MSSVKFVAHIVTMVTCVAMVTPVTILDMSYKLDHSTPMWSPWLQDRPTLTALDKSGLRRMNNFRTGEHVGTHLDAPAHIILENSKSPVFLNQIALDQLYGSAVSIDIRGRFNSSLDQVDYAVTVEDIKQHESKHGQIPQGAIVFTCTGWTERSNNPSRFWGGNASNPESWHFPGYDVTAARWLLQNRSVKGLAVDTPSCDPGQIRDLLAHKALFSANKWCLENVAHTCKLPQTPGRATVYLFPNKVPGGSGTPVRVVAFIEDTPDPPTNATQGQTIGFGIGARLIFLLLVLLFIK